MAKKPVLKSQAKIRPKMKVPRAPRDASHPYGRRRAPYVHPPVYAAPPAGAPRLVRNGVIISPKWVIQKQGFVSGGMSGGVKAEVFYAYEEGMEGIVATLEDLPRACRDAAGYEMQRILEEVIDDAKENYVPFKFGHLRDSGMSDEYKPDRFGTTPIITELAAWFGGRFTGEQIQALGVGPSEAYMYAEEQHENALFKHSPPPNLSGWKYLERPWLKMMPRVVPRIAAIVSDALGLANTADKD